MKHPKKISDYTKHLYQLVLIKNRSSSSSWALNKLHWLLIQQRIEYKILTTAFKCITSMAPKYLQDLISIKNNTQDNMHSNSTDMILHIQKSSTKPLQHSLSGILHQQYGTSYQSPSKIHQPLTSSRRS